jgi:hypothetical protein
VAGKRVAGRIVSCRGARTTSLRRPDKTQVEIRTCFVLGVSSKSQTSRRIGDQACIVVPRRHFEPATSTGRMTVCACQENENDTNLPRRIRRELPPVKKPARVKPTSSKYVTAQKRLRNSPRPHTLTVTVQPSTGHLNHGHCRFQSAASVCLEQETPPFQLREFLLISARLAALLAADSCFFSECGRGRIASYSVRADSLSHS